MMHEMRLNYEPFELIKNGSKTIELRLNDEKRKLIKVGDIIRFTNIITNEQLETKVIALHKYDSFKNLYRSLDKIAIGYQQDEVADYKDMELYYSKEEQEQYGVVGIELTLLKKCKNIIYNNDNLKINDINRIVKRAKIIFENAEGQLILCHSNGNYFLLGGHVDGNETDMECLYREILEETGAEIKFQTLSPFITIKYFNKDYPETKTNSLTIANYYYLNYNLEPKSVKQNLTEDEIKGGFKLDYIDKNEVIGILERSLASSTRKGVTLDTIEVIKEYLKIIK